MLKNNLWPVLFIFYFGFYSGSNLTAEESGSATGKNKSGHSELNAAEKLVRKMGDLKTYQAEFEQRVRNEAGQQIDFSSGKFYIQRPNLFRWEVIESFEQIIIADGDQLFTYDPELEQVTIQNQSSVLSESPLLLMTSSADKLSEAFDIELLALENDSDVNLFQLIPKKEGNVFSKIHILFNQGQIAELMMADTLGQQTSIQFSQIKTNMELEQNLFRFDMPENIDVIDSREIPVN